MVTPKLLSGKLYWKPVKLEDWLLLSVVFSLGLLMARVLVTGLITYMMLPWNLFLAYIPLAITRRMKKDLQLLEHQWKFVLVLGVWLLFIPNSFYIITDLFHLTHIDSAPKWFDLLLLFSFAWNGLIFGVLSTRQMELFTHLQWGAPFSRVFVFAVMWLSAFGVYIGRYLRYNSWDIFTDPFSLLSEIGEMMLHPFNYGFAWGMTLCYAAFMSLVYFTLRKLKVEN